MILTIHGNETGVSPRKNMNTCTLIILLSIFHQQSLIFNFYDRNTKGVCYVSMLLSWNIQIATLKFQRSLLHIWDVRGKNKALKFDMS